MITILAKRFSNGRIRRANEGAMKVPLRHEGWRKGTLKSLF
jgi:hypothetical protein